MLNSVKIATEPQFGQVVVHTSGQITYIPNNTFVQSDHFTYTIEDDEAGVSNTAWVAIGYVPKPSVIIEDKTATSLTLGWTIDESLETSFLIEQRQLGNTEWYYVDFTPVNQSSIVLDTLVEGVEYEFRVRAYSNGYASEISDIVSTQEQVAIEEPDTNNETDKPTNDGSNDSGSGSGGSMPIWFLLVLCLMLHRRKVNNK